ncbi:serine hydrolase domain-containing protein [Pseudoteredinibacter isoporae]|uniref:CubicO group peptidase (Beta-lactamase class C family) n=1 Tax=Pseudoteredinibacter isoporae TaxID=570281 RepID=A0A7X0JTS9_9GAMM|nr:serine hydrolase [Pseudoteredinibacter isoporae]MBB6521261.1 CubicO group peptidase (beta-lactamase class C family) [Pseudoteredinibacter isoporae]
MDKFERASFATSLFNGEKQHHKFSRVAEFMPVTTMTAAAKPFQFPEGKPIQLPQQFSFGGETVNSEAFLSETDTAALLVIASGEVRFERYRLSGGRDVNWLSMSVAKSVIATAIGIAVDEQLIDIHKPMTDYVPSLKGSAYDGVKIKDVLQMSSGAAWSEDYANPDSDVMRLGKVMALGGSMDEFVQGMTREWEPGTANRYNSGDTQALGMLLTAATGTSITQYVQDKLWHPLGMESDAYWIVDDYDMEMAFGGLNATARDYAKIGELYRQQGRWQGQRIVSQDWVEKATKPDAPYLMPGIHEDFPLGYGYQWWIPETSEGEYMAIGVYNQFIYINPSRDLVIVKLSANPSYGTTNDEASNQELETIEFLRAIAQGFPKH